MTKFHHTGCEQAQGHDGPVKRLMVAMQCDSLAWEILVDEHVIKRLLRQAVVVHAGREGNTPGWNWLNQTLIAAIRAAVKLSAAVPRTIPGLFVDHSHELQFLRVRDVTRAIRKPGNHRDVTRLHLDWE